MAYTPFVWLLVTSALIMGSIAHYTRHFQDILSVKPFRALMWIVMTWAVLYGLGISVVNFPVKLFIVNLTYIPSALSALATLALALEYTGHGKWLTRRRLAYLLTISAIFVLFAFTSTWHSFWRYDYQLVWSETVPVIIAAKGPVYWAYITYMVLLSLASYALLVTSFKVRTLYFRNTLILTIGMVVPFIVGILYVFGLTPVRGFDWLPTSFIWTGLLYLWATTQGRLFDVSPIARNILVETIDDLVIVLNNKGMVLDFNRSARSLVGLKDKSVGSSYRDLSQPWADVFQRYADTPSCREEIFIKLDSDTRAYELTISPVQVQPGQVLGRLFLFYDITRQKQAESDERQQRILAQALRDTAEALNSTLNYDSVLDKILNNVERVVPIEAANIALMDNQERLHYVRFIGYDKYNLSTQELEKMSFTLDELPVSRKVFETGEPLVIPDTSLSPLWTIAPRLEWIHSYAAMPIRIKNKVVGILNLDGHTLGLYSSDHLQYLQAFASQVAIAIENARLMATAEREILERKLIEQKLRQLSHAVEQSPVSIVITDKSGKIEYVNPRFSLVTGYSFEEVLGQNPRILKTTKTSPGVHDDLWKTITNEREWHGEFINRKKNGEVYYESAIISPLFDEQGEITHFLAVKEDITERKKNEQEIQELQSLLREQAIRDPLTGLYNRRYLDEIIHREMARSEREGQPLSFVMIDIDHFKDVNDNFGHTAGDRILQRLATQLLSQTRSSDIVFRYGGEEFLALLPAANADFAFQVATRWRKLFIGSTLMLDFPGATATISCGVAVYPKHGNTASEIILAADQALYRAKAAGRNCVVIWQNTPSVPSESNLQPL